MLVQRIAPGYNCKGNCWIGPARVTAVYDTGSTRNSIDKEFLEGLIKTSATRAAVVEVRKTEPLSCKSVDRNNSIVIKSIAYVNV